MKQVNSIFLVIFLALCNIQANAQDIMVKLYGTSTIEEKVKTISVYEKSIIYKEWNHLDGPTYEISRRNVHKIIYENGKIDYFTDIPVVKAPKYRPIKLQSHITFSGTLGGRMYGLEMDCGIGMNIRDYLYAGLNIGMGYMDGGMGIAKSVNAYYTNICDLYFPLGVNLKVYLLKDKKVIPYIGGIVGGYISSTYNNHGLYCKAGAGFDMRYFTFGMGYNAFIGPAYKLHAGYISVGVRFGGWN